MDAINRRYQPKGDGYFIDRQMEHRSDLIEYNFDSRLSDNGFPVIGILKWKNSITMKVLYGIKRNFNHDLKSNGEATYLLFWSCKIIYAVVYLNGEKIGEHTGGYTPFYFTVTGKLKEKDTLLVVKVDC